MLRRFTATAGRLLLGLAALAGPCAAAPKVIVLRSKNLAPFEQAAQQFKKCLAAKGVQAAFEDATLPDDAGQLDAVLQALAGGKPALFFTIGSQASVAVRQRLKTSPSVFAMVIDPAAAGLEKGGVSMDPRPADYLDYIRRRFPTLKRVGVLYNPAKSKAAADALSEADAAVVLQPVSDIAQLDAALKALKSKADCLLMIVDTSIYNPKTAGPILLQSLQSNLPMIAVSSAFVKAGALAGTYADPEDNGCLAAELAARVLGGEKVHALPLLSPKKLKSSVNLVVAERLHIKVPAEAVAEAEEVVK